MGMDTIDTLPANNSVQSSPSGIYQMPYAPEGVGNNYQGGGGNNNSNLTTNIAGGAGGAAALGQIGLGIYQGFQARKMANGLTRPTMQIPDAIKNNMTIAQQASLEGLPDEQKQQYLDNVARTQSLMLNGAANRGDSLNAISAIGAQGNEANKNLLNADSQQRINNRTQLYGVNDTASQYQQQAFGYNQAEPYQQKQNKVNALQNTQWQNIFGGAKGIENTAGQAAQLAMLA